MYVGLEADAFAHRVSDSAGAIGGCEIRAHDRADVHLAAFEEAASQDTVGSQTQAIAGVAEGGGHGADEADPTERVSVSESVRHCRTNPRFACAIDRNQRTHLALD